MSAQRSRLEVAVLMLQCRYRRERRDFVICYWTDSVRRYAFAKEPGGWTGWSECGLGISWESRHVANELAGLVLMMGPVSIMKVGKYGCNDYQAQKRPNGGCNSSQDLDFIVGGRSER